MNGVSNNNYASGYTSAYSVAGSYAYSDSNKANSAKSSKTDSSAKAGASTTSSVSKDSKTDKTSAAEVTKTKVNGQTIGNPKLSEKASKYYEQLKKKYSNMNFILVSEDMKEQAKASASSYANANNMVVLIDEDKIERMAEDENYRKQYEGIIANAASGLSQLGQSIAATGASVKGYGMQVNDNGTASYFAVLEKSSAAQKERIEKKAAKNKAEKKEAAKKAEKEKQKERLDKTKNKYDDSDSDTITIEASSMEELLQKIQEQSQSYLSDIVQTDSEKKVGQRFDSAI